MNVGGGYNSIHNKLSEVLLTLMVAQLTLYGFNIFTKSVYSHRNLWNITCIALLF